MTTKALIFDYDGVMTFNVNRDEDYARAARALGLSVEELYQRLWETDGWQRVKRGQIDEADFWRAALPLVGMAPADAPYGPLAFLIKERLDPAMLDLTRRLKPHFQLALLSNATLGYEPRWEFFELPTIFDVMVNSARVGLAKPDAEIYHLTLEWLGRPPDECLFIDDKPRNVIAAEALGIPSIVFTTAADLEVELERRGILAPEIA